MAAKWANPVVLDGGLSAIKSGCNKMHLISAYTAADSYATVVANTLASVTMASTDFTISSSGTSRVLTVAAGKSAVATAAATGTPDLAIAFTDGASTVYWVTDETSNQPISIGVLYNFPVVTYTSAQPT